MSTALLDLNLFIALVWPAHQQHGPAHKWFQSRGRASWASCPLTQLGLVRLLSNPAFSPDALTLNQAVALLKKNIDHPLHEFWPDSLTAVRSLQALAHHTGGHRQVSDAYLLGLAIHRKARLATFDAGLRQLARNAGKETHVELIS